MKLEICHCNSGFRNGIRSKVKVSIALRVRDIAQHRGKIDDFFSLLFSKSGKSVIVKKTYPVTLTLNY